MAAKIKFQTPIGTAKYPWLTKPDTQFNSEGIYTTQLITDPTEAKALVDMLQEVALEEFGAKAKVAMPFEQDEETGEIVFKAKSKFAPKFFDTRGEVVPLESMKPVYGGSRIRIKGIANPYTVTGRKGISLTVNAVQVIEIVSGGGSGGFDAVDGGFVAEKASQTDKFDDVESDEDFEF